MGTLDYAPDLVHAQTPLMLSGIVHYFPCILSYGNRCQYLSNLLSAGEQVLVLKRYEQVIFLEKLKRSR